MKIVKYGNIPTPKINALFRCPNCNCEFLANIHSECSISYHEYYGYAIYSCNCPQCGVQSLSTKTAE
jgi:hypothetical protein